MVPPSKPRATAGQMPQEGTQADSLGLTAWRSASTGRLSPAIVSYREKKPQAGWGGQAGPPPTCLTTGGARAPDPRCSHDTAPVRTAPSSVPGTEALCPTPGRPSPSPWGRPCPTSEAAPACLPQSLLAPWARTGSEGRSCRLSSVEPVSASGPSCHAHAVPYAARDGRCSRSEPTTCPCLPSHRAGPGRALRAGGGSPAPQVACGGPLQGGAPWQGTGTPAVPRHGCRPRRTRPTASPPAHKDRTRGAGVSLVHVMATEVTGGREAVTPKGPDWRLTCAPLWVVLRGFPPGPPLS